jgi:hypothetical protein
MKDDDERTSLANNLLVHQANHKYKYEFSLMILPILDQFFSAIENDYIDKDMKSLNIPILLEKMQDNLS